jgi:hypothetical protein
MITGISESSASCRSAASTDHPSKSGIMTSWQLDATLWHALIPPARPRRSQRKNPLFEIVGDQVAGDGIIIDDKDRTGYRCFTAS